MKHLIQKIIVELIKKQAFLNDYPNPQVVFLAIDSVFNDANLRKIVAEAVMSAINTQSFDSVAGISSRGYIFSGMIASQTANVGEQFIQKVKKRGDSHFNQVEMKTEYSQDALQVLKNTIQPGKKYLLTDDLLATGGSILSAVQLIRDGGGIVDTVFVMTELLDLGARERLEQAGIKVISLLKFNHDDLLKLLSLQKQYLDDPEKSITYQLSHHEQLEDALNIDRLVDLNGKKSKNKYFKQQQPASSPKALPTGKTVNLYNHGCPVNAWNIDPEIVKLTDFKVFSTGDAFSILSPEIDIHNASINIHVGVRHESFSPSVLLQEALQLCRLAYEHGASDITISLPESYHPSLGKNHFNSLLKKMFKASGANRMYFYDEHYQGKLDLKKIDRKDEQATPHIVLCCSSNQPLAEDIARNLRENGETVKLYLTEGRDTDARIPDEAEISGAVVTIVQSTRPNPDNIQEAHEYQVNGASSYFFEAAMIAREAHLRGAAKINFINPYQFSARSDKAEDNPKGKTGAYVQHNGMLFKAAGVNQVISAECHDAHTMSGSYTGKHIKGSAVQALSVMATRIASDWLFDPNHALQGQLRLVTPDAGATKRTKELTMQLQAILGKRLCESRVLCEKERDSHKDDSAMINSLNSGEIGINANDKYLITDDETATGNTLCQAITNLTKNGAKDISVIIVHNNMPLDWLSRQLCLARFLYIGVNDLHFSDTQEMGTLACDYDNLIKTACDKSSSPISDIESQVFDWFKKNVTQEFADQSDEHLAAEFNQFKTMFHQFQSRIKIHSLAKEFARQVRTTPYQAKAYSSNVESMLLFKKPTESKTHLPPAFTNI